TATDLLSVTLAVSAASVVVALFVGIGRIFGFVGDFSRPVLLIDWLLSLVLVGGLRMSVRVIGEANDTSRRAAAPGTARRAGDGAARGKRGRRGSGRYRPPRAQAHSALCPEPGRLPR